MTQSAPDNPSRDQLPGASIRGAQAWYGFAAALLICFGAAAIGGGLTARSLSTWYPSLVKPALTPPDWVFGPVWTLLYAAMGIAAWLVWRRRGMRAAAVPLALFALQLALNVAWSALFFGLQSPGAAVVDIVLLWLSIAATMVSFWRVSPAAGLLFVPYLAWVSFATWLNIAIWRLN